MLESLVLDRNDLQNEGIKILFDSLLDRFMTFEREKGPIAFGK